MAAANVVAPSKVRTSWPVIFGWMSRLPESPLPLPGSQRNKTRTLPQRATRAYLMIHYVQLDRVARPIEDPAVQDLDRRDAHAGDARGQTAAQRLYLG
jgi:hypothetical protein